MTEGRRRERCGGVPTPTQPGDRLRPWARATRGSAGGVVGDAVAASSPSPPFRQGGSLHAGEYSAGITPAFNVDP